LECLQLFPACFKQVVSTNRHQNQKKDTITTLFEDLTKMFMLQEKQIADLALKFLCCMFKARDKCKVTFKEWVTKVLTNILLFLDAIKPRLFSDTDLNKPLPINDTCFDFIFDKEASDDRSDLNKLTIKEMRAQLKDQQLVSIKLDYLFKALEYTFAPQVKAQQLAG
jgi:hypothetical protein